MHGLNLAELTESDLEALVALKLCEEIGLGLEATKRLLSGVDALWMRAFLDSGPPAIGGERLSFQTLRRARLYRARARRAGRCLIERSPTA